MEGRGRGGSERRGRQHRDSGRKHRAPNLLQGSGPVLLTSSRKSQSTDRRQQQSRAKGHFWKGRERKGENKATHSLVYWLITHTPDMYTNINIPMYKCTQDSQITSSSLSSSTPSLRPIYLSRLHCRTKACRGLAVEGRKLEEGEVLLPSPHRYLQRVLSLCSGTTGQRARIAPLPLCCKSQMSPLVPPSLPFSSSLI